MRVHSRVHRRSWDIRSHCKPMILLVGAGRFERPTPCAQGRCATRLRYAPTFADHFILNHFQIPAKSSSLFLRPNCFKTVSKPFQFGLTAAEPLTWSLVWRFGFKSLIGGPCRI